MLTVVRGGCRRGQWVLCVARVLPEQQRREYCFLLPLRLQSTVAHYPRHVGWIGLDWLRPHFPLDSRGSDIRPMCYVTI